MTHKSSAEKKPEVEGLEHVITRLKRLFKILKIDEAYDGTVVFDDADGKEVSIELPLEEGKFELYFIMNEAKTEFSEYLYIANENENAPVGRFLADIRVLIETVKRIIEFDENAAIKFIIATNDNLDQHKKDVLIKFSEMKKIADLDDKKNINLELWDDITLREKEKDLGIYL